MLYVINKNGEDLFAGHKRDGKTRLANLLSPGIQTDLTVQADEDELAIILYQIKGIPTSERRVQKWRGDAARFIVDNLIL